VRALTLLLLPALLAGAEAPPAAQTAADPVASVRAYAARYQRDAPSLVAREDYTQTATYRRGIEYLELTSELVMVRLHGAAGWMSLRDVLTVNKRKVRDREERLLKLLQSPQPDALVQARKIAEESARFNLGRLTRTVNVPDVAIEYLQARHADRIRFESPRTATIDGVGVVVLRFSEVAGPSIVRGFAGRDLLARGRVWAEPESGALVRTELLFEDRVTTGSCTVDFRFEPRLGIRVPVKMTERYRMSGELIDGVARYSDFRSFTVSTTEKVGKPPGP
jgi:hypothetical protein